MARLTMDPWYGLVTSSQIPTLRSPVYSAPPYVEGPSAFGPESYRAPIARPEPHPGGMSTSHKVVMGVGALLILGLGAYAVLTWPDTYEGFLVFEGIIAQAPDRAIDPALIVGMTEPAGKARFIANNGAMWFDRFSAMGWRFWAPAPAVG